MSTDEKQHGKSTRSSGDKGNEKTSEEFVTIKIPESLGGTGNVVQFPVASFNLINEYLLSTGHEYLSTGTEDQQRAIEQWIGLMPARQAAVEQTAS